MDDEWRLGPTGYGHGFTHELVFVEEVAGEREDLVAGIVEFLRTVRGVTAVEHADREAVLITAEGVPAGRLSALVRRRWEKARKQRPAWMAAMDRAARTVWELTGFERDGWQLTRVVDDGLSHLITLDHGFGREPGEHSVTITAYVRLALPDRHHHEVLRHVGDLGDAGQLREAVTGRVLPALEPLTSVDALLDRWGTRKLPEIQLRGRVLVSLGRLDEARDVYQIEFDRTQPRHRPYLLRSLADLGVPPLTTAADPRLSVGEAATLAAWHTSTLPLTDRLRQLSGLRLDGTRGSLDELWAWLRDAREQLRAAFADTRPALPMSSYGVLAGGTNAAAAPRDPWYRVTVELVTAYIGEVVIAQAPGTVWALGDGGELALVRRSGTGLPWRVLAIVHEVFGVPADEFDPHELRRLADDMLRWLNADSAPQVWITHSGA
ncbi:hypothetical protein Ait01nite_084800 [Actinoplanes italicus]|uniref:Uncharacterized protein n=1 Tax=Actinoplanes italicus TaxID=113567 RepID=A0A2T0JXD9_9ACTN|nr:hypothetical protein [Actinoplanes italicus]PRX12665.1 hypothetical protein CLV67_12788 [Actinoplanes italicus]GIE35435.1 hypothetical protein Ait01nite_084800 [Actinoplanes italicus]